MSRMKLQMSIAEQLKLDNIMGKLDKEDHKLARVLFSIERYGRPDVLNTGIAPPIYLILAYHLKDNDNAKTLINTLQKRTTK